jgi:putative FmdB family regulatory protein
MPVYEFRCLDCGARVALFFRSYSTEAGGTCDRCGSVNLEKLVSRVAVVRPPVQAKDLNKNQLLDGVDFTNPASMASMFRQMGDMFHDDDRNEAMDEILGRLDHDEPVEHALGLDEHAGHHHD